MNWRILFRALASVYFAVFLIGASVIFAIVGTFIESSTHSHLIASKWTTSSSLFKLLLWLFFINILFAAIRRWPFKKKHLPFILAHLGLLMILSGVLIKSYFGTQGELFLTEGETTRSYFIKDSYALLFETPHGKHLLSLKKNRCPKRFLPTPYRGVEIKVVEWKDHCEITYDRWIKGNKLDLMGVGTLEAIDLTEKPLPNSLPLHFQASPAAGEPLWYFYAFLTEDPLTVLPLLKKPALAFFRNKVGEEKLVAINANGNSHEESFPQNTVSSLLVFDKGYGGYALFAELPASFSTLNRPIELSTRLVRKCICRPNAQAEPALTLLIKTEEREEIITLPFDKFATQMKWPILNGKALVRFQPMQHSFPFALRLTEGRKVAYPENHAPFSYECDFKLIRPDTIKEVSISMNKVHETQEGYRFYMANLQFPAQMGAKKVLIVVSRDPAKYLLTYPGALVVTLATVLLFLNLRKIHG